MPQNAAMPLPVSVQVCTLNEADNIGPCLSMIAANDPQEIIVIDGGSTDGTADIAQAAGARVLTPGRLGLGPSRQLGYMAATTEFVAFVDADDRIGPGWLQQMMSELEAGGYAALQSSLRAVDEGTFWSRGWDSYFRESVRPTADTIMVGRPAIFRADALRAATRAAGGSLPSLDEDTHLSRWFQQMRYRQGIGTPVAHRRVDQTLRDNLRKWCSYGVGYRAFAMAHPDRRIALLRHILVTIPVARSVGPVLRGKLEYPLFAALMSLAIYRGWRLGPHHRPPLGMQA